MRLSGSVWLAALIVTASGCAAVKVRPAKEGAEGVRFYPPHPYLLVSQSKENGIQGTIVYLPKVNEPYLVSVSSGFGSVDAKLTLENGWNLTQFGAVADSKSEALITALSGLLTSAGARGLLTRKDQELVPGLYAIEFDATTGLAKSLRPVYQVEAP
jgi:hypothetical protein